MVGVARRARSLVIIAVLLLLGTACPGEATDARPDRRASSRVAGSVTDDDLLARLDQVWRYVAEDAGEYTEVSSFADSPSLYETAWTLRLTRQYGIDVPRFVPSQATPWLLELLHDPSRNNASAPLPSLVVVNLAAPGLAILGTPPPFGLVSRQLDALRSQWGYALRPGESPDWGATVIAVETLDLVGASIATDIAAELRRQVPAVTVTDAPAADWVARFLPIWSLAPRLLTADELNVYRSDVAVRLQELVAFLAASGCSGFNIIALAGSST